MSRSVCDGNRHPSKRCTLTKVRVQTFGMTTADARAVSRLVQQVLRTEASVLASVLRTKHSQPGPIQPCSLNVVLVDNCMVRQLNRRFLGRQRNTDVIAFPSHPAAPFPMLGEIYIARQVARRQARGQKISFRQELMHLTLHGLLHLLGYSHRRMRPRVSRYLSSCLQPSGQTRIRRKQ